MGVYAVEMMPIFLALQWVEEHKPGNMLICSDSVSVLKGLRSLSTFKNSPKLYISEVYVAHIGVKGNEEVDKLAKQALHREIIEMQVPLSKSEVSVLIYRRMASSQVQP